MKTTRQLDLAGVARRGCRDALLSETRDLLRAPVAWLLATVLLAGLPMNSAFAFVPRLSSQDVLQALSRGTSMAAEGHPFDLGKYLVAAESNGIDVRKGSVVDAVVLRTPYERLEYRAYKAAYQGHDMTKEQARRLAQRFGAEVQLVVFAHSPRPGIGERDFLQKFSHATLLLKHGRTLSPVSAGRAGLAEDFFAVKGEGRQILWLGSVSYTFKIPTSLLNGHTAECVFSFLDSAGHQHSYHVNLKNFY